MSKKKYWYNTKIPAYLFFEILESEKLKKLTIEGKPSKGDLRKAWSKIFDEFFTIKNDAQLKQILRRKNNIIRLNAEIKSAENALRVITMLQGVLVDSRLKESLKSLYESLKLLNIHLDIEKPINTEVLNALQISIAGLKTKLSIEEDELGDITKGAKSSFEDSCVAFETALGVTTNEIMSLRKYLSYEKSFKEKNKRARQQNKKRN